MHGNRATISLTAALFLSLTLAACAPKYPPGTELTTPRAAWSSFRAHYCVPAKETALKVKASLYYSQVTPRKRTNRTLVTLWGDFDGAMRLDVSASIGRLLAHIREDETGLLVYYPDEKSAYVHADPILGSMRLGMPFPFSLSELGRIMTGDFSGLAPRKHAAATRSGDKYVFEVDHPLVTRITLDLLGRPVLMEGETQGADGVPQGWRLEINSYEDLVLEDGKVVAPLPRKLTLSVDNGEKGVLHIKSRELMLAAWPEKSLSLPLPEGTLLYRLDND